MIYEKNEHFVMEADKDMIFITVCQKGFSILQLNPILLDFSQIMLENVKGLKYALTEASGERIQLGRRTITELDIAADKMSASVKLNCSILESLQSEGISEGILMHVLQNELSIKEPTIIAKGTFYQKIITCILIEGLI
ncbi:hypothetical protein [Peribacillus simplex]|uniref:hypothetical protein n=1 Tax=Peribacillus simplex TaxID=1478 RepID=UPI0011AABB44|nr:hypothetical protein [Peribacillus simplex]